MSKSLALEYAKKNININCISPGFIKTAMTDKLDENYKEAIVSKIPSNTNGSFNIKTGNINVPGVNFILLSDSQNVVIFPDRGSDITLNEHRDFEFKGKIKAGFLELFGDGFNFNYDNSFNL